MGGVAMDIVSTATGWGVFFGLGESASPLVTLPLAFVFFFFFILFPLYFFLGFAERKLAADLQARVGPNRTPGSGALQVFADTLKLGAKGASARESKRVRRGAAAQNAFLYATFAFLPLGSTLVFLDSEWGAFLPLLCMGAVFLAALFSSEGAKEVEIEILSQRQAFLWVSSWIPALIATTVSVARAGSGRWTAILETQSHGFLSWSAFSSPFGFVAFFVFLLSGMVAFQLPPFHVLDRGVGRRAGLALGVYSLNQFYAVLVWCLIASGLFLGGQSVPELGDVSFGIAAAQLGIAIAKASLLYVAVRVVARALPQLRQDQMTEFCWRILTPIASLCLVGELVWLRLFSRGASL